MIAKEERAYLIRQATAADLPAVVDLELEAFSDSGTAECLEVFRSRLEVFPAGFFVCTVEGTVVGYATSEKWLEERQPVLNEIASAAHNTEGRIFCITGLAVRLSHRGHGFGLALLDALIQLARRDRCTRVVLETTHGQRIYLKRGFHISHDCVQSGIKFSVMKLDLD
jgi:N-acetylglutamate synthase-like GNAT family acetyltransferase